MEIVDKEDLIDDLRSRNLPFVLFREPGRNPKFLIQETPLERIANLEIKQKGFYMFPFSKNEKASPLYLKPDFICDWADVGEYKFSFDALPLPVVPEQELFEIDQENYTSDLKRYFAAFDKGIIKKAIYSRIKNEILDRDLNISRFFQQISDKYNKAFTYVVNIPGDGLWIGASPELLLSYKGQTAKTVALAGTLKINRNIPAPNWTRKEIDEHRIVERHIIKLCDEMNLKYEKSPVRSSSTGKVYHLKSDFSIQVAADQIITFLQRLHPTPAISGLPKEDSIELIYDVEKHERSYYCGFLGWVNDVSEFKLFINLRCLKLRDRMYSLFAGGGITPESDIDKEWNETEIKMATLTDLLSKEHSFSEQ